MGPKNKSDPLGPEGTLEGTLEGTKELWKELWKERRNFGRNFGRNGRNFGRNFGRNGRNFGRNFGRNEENNEEIMEEYRKYDHNFDWWQLAIVLMFALMGIGLVTSCKTKYVSVPEYHTEYIVRSDTTLRLDSVWLHDSVYVYHSGDTIIINKVAYRDRYKYLYKTKTDTIWKRDSITTIKPVERTLTKVEQRYITIGKTCAYIVKFVLIAAILALICWLVKKKLNR